VAKEIVISERDNIGAIIENGKIVEFFVNEGEQLVGDIILGKVDSIVQSIDAAFVSIGKNKNGFIHVTDLNLSVKGRRKTNIKGLIAPKQNILVQIAKEATGNKGPRLTGMLTIPGRYLVLTPYERKIGLSKKIEDPYERQRLINISKEICQSGYGLIVRTEASGQSEESLKEDLDFLLKRWQEILRLSEKGVAPAVLYRDQDLLYRILRDALTPDTDTIIVDTPEAKRRAMDILQSWSSNTFNNVELYKGNRPLAVHYGLFADLENSLQPKVPLPSGGYLVIEETEALTVVDVNSGSSRNTSSLHETIIQTNKEAAVEIARQLRLRDIGGVIVVDFIDMVDPREQQIVWQTLAASVRNDKAQPQIGYFSEFSLLEMTRHRQRRRLSELLTAKCHYCEGIGKIRNKLYRVDVLDNQSAMRRVSTPEKLVTMPGEVRNKIDEFKGGVEYFEDKNIKIPQEVLKYKKNFQGNRFEYQKFDKKEKEEDNNGFKDDGVDFYEEPENEFSEIVSEEVKYLPEKEDSFAETEVFKANLDRDEKDFSYYNENKDEQEVESAVETEEPKNLTLFPETEKKPYEKNQPKKRGRKPTKNYQEKEENISEERVQVPVIETVKPAIEVIVSEKATEPLVKKKKPRKIRSFAPKKKKK